MGVDPVQVRQRQGRAPRPEGGKAGKAQTWESIDDVVGDPVPGWHEHRRELAAKKCPKPWPPLLQPRKKRRTLGPATKLHLLRWRNRMVGMGHPVLEDRRRPA